MIALAAATIAWAAAQRQIRFARQQSAVIAYEALRRNLEIVVEERQTVSDILQVTQELAIACSSAQNLPEDGFDLARTTIARAEFVVRESGPLNARFRELERRVWGGTQERVIRYQAIFRAGALPHVGQAMADDITEWFQHRDNARLAGFGHVRQEFVREIAAELKLLADTLQTEEARLSALTDHYYAAFISEGF